MTDTHNLSDGILQSFFYRNIKDFNFYRITPDETHSE